ncbi:helix-turn-helix domain-containing protein [Ktedonobacteria bacterium brp13]|nr:helix-turn-helix domain-containing protein [Ktedonobacteria bacterium brp13]
MDEEKKINEALRHARLEHGWTQKDLANQLGVAESTVRSWEQRKRFPNPELLVRLSKALEKSPHELDLLTSPELMTEQQTSEDADVDRLALTADVGEVTAHEPWKEAHALTNRSPIFLLKPEDENRQRMIQRVHSRWISGFLDPVSSGSLIDLSLRTRSDVVASPWRAKNQEPYGSMLHTSHLSISTLIREAYNEADGELLILGEPGAGKTTLLLELTRELLERCRMDDAFPIPVIFNLASWAAKRAPFIDWLIEELHVTYQVPVKLAVTWITNDQVIPLLDGLDEVPLPVRSACVLSINEYRQDHGLMPIVVCCRTSDYEALPERLILNTAVEVQPLTLRQIKGSSRSSGNADRSSERSELARGRFYSADVEHFGV